MSVEFQYPEQLPTRVVVDNHNAAQVPIDSTTIPRYTPSDVTLDHLQRMERLSEDLRVDDLLSLAAPMMDGDRARTGMFRRIRRAAGYLEYVQNRRELFEGYYAPPSTRQGLSKLHELGMNITVCSGTSEQHNYDLFHSWVEQGLYDYLDPKNPAFLVRDPDEISEHIWNGKLPMALTKMAVLEFFRLSEGRYPILFEDRIDILAIATRYGVPTFSPLTLDETWERQSELIKRMPEPIQQLDVSKSVRFGTTLIDVAEWVQDQQKKTGVTRFIAPQALPWPQLNDPEYTADNAQL